MPLFQLRVVEAVMLFKQANVVTRAGQVVLISECVRKVIRTHGLSSLVTSSPYVIHGSIDGI
ncbi:hypothetical protein [Candidatus Nitrotoga sp. M5]|uniref:hypothetical protein n=1 Tax=Candidatus Nitrotoga sp. M5 TaxID=2890409 RepID=UPI001EF36218|nr:hypothetical protein [Candidatus Nitrotoga sp. M5]CAH1386608.1 hypothetical protein NTGM5_30117 [Candidatus Nitrotoga sp. M5]